MDVQKLTFVIVILQVGALIAGSATTNMPCVNSHRWLPIPSLQKNMTQNFSAECHRFCPFKLKSLLS